MGVAGRMKHAGSGVGNVCGDIHEAQAVHEAYSRLAVAFKAESYYSALSVGQVLLRTFVVRVGGQAAVANPSHTLVGGKELCNALGICAMLAHAKVQRLKTHVQEKCVLWGWRTSEVAHQLCHEFCRISKFSKGFRVCQPMIRLVRRRESWKHVGVGVPVEVSTIDNASSHLRGEAVHVFRRAVRDDVASPFEGAAEYWRCECVVDYEGHVVGMRNAGELLDVEDCAARVRDGLAEKGACVWAEGCRYLLL